MRSVKWLAVLAGSGVLAMLGTVYGCSSSSDHPPVLDGTGNDSGHPSSSSGGRSGGSSGSSSGGMMCLSEDGGCTDLQLCGPKVNVTNATGMAPAPQGGTIVPGTYVLTAVDYYGPGGGWLRQTIRLTAIGGDGGAAEGGDDAAAGEAGDGSASEAGGEGGPEGGGDMGPDATADAGASSATFTSESIVVTDTSPLSTSVGTLSFTNLTTLNIALTCPGSTAPFTAGYTATATTLALIVSPEVLTYTKQ
jgi:hypothetical protein